MNHTYIIESNRQTAYRDVYEATKNRTVNTSDVNMPNHEWKTYIENGVPVEKGDIIQVEATQINLRGDESEEIELTGGGTNPGRNPISDNETKLEYGFYIANRQEFNFPLPLATHQIHFNPASQKHGAMNAEVMRRFVNSCPIQTVQGFGVQLETGAATTGKYKLITPLNSRRAGWMPDFSYGTGATNNDVVPNMPTAMSLPPVSNGPLSIFHPNQVRMYKLLKTNPPLYPIFKQSNSVAAYPNDKPQTAKDLMETNSINLKIPAGFHTPTSVAAKLTAQMQQKTGNGDSWETDEPAIQYTRRFKSDDLTSSVTTSLKVNDFSTATYKICNTASGDFCEAYSATGNDRFRGSYYAANRGAEGTNFPRHSGNFYVESDAHKLLYKNMLVGDVPRYMGAYNWGLLSTPYDNVTFLSAATSDAIQSYSDAVDDGTVDEKIFLDWGEVFSGAPDPQYETPPGLLGPNVVYLDNMNHKNAEVADFTFCAWTDGRSGGPASTTGGVGAAQQVTVSTFFFTCKLHCPFPTNILCSAAAVKLVKAAFAEPAHIGPFSSVKVEDVGTGIDSIYDDYVVDLQFGRIDDQYTSTTTRQYGANDDTDGNWGFLNDNQQVLTNQMCLPNCLTTYKLMFNSPAGSGGAPHGPSGSGGPYDWTPSSGRADVNQGYRGSEGGWAAYSDIQVPYNLPLTPLQEPFVKFVTAMDGIGSTYQQNMGEVQRLRHIASANENDKYRTPFLAYWSDFIETLDDSFLPDNSFFTFFDPDGNRFPSDIFKPQGDGDKGVAACGLFIKINLPIPWWASTGPPIQDSTPFRTPYMAFISAAGINVAGPKRIDKKIPRIRMGEFFGFSPSFQDLQCAKIINTQTINNDDLFDKVAQNYTQQDLDKTLVGRQQYEFEVPGTSGTVGDVPRLPKEPVQTFSPFDYVSYVHIGADNPTFTFSSTGSGKFEINQLHTAIRVGNSSYADSQAPADKPFNGNYTSNTSFADPILEMYSLGKSVVSQYYGGGFQHADSLWNQGLLSGAAVTDTQKSDGTLAYNFHIQYAMTPYQMVIGGPNYWPDGDETRSPNDRRDKSTLWIQNQLSQLPEPAGSPILSGFKYAPSFVLRAMPFIFVQQVVDKICPINSAQSGIGLLSLSAPHATALTHELSANTDVNFSAEAPYSFNGSLFDKLGFSIEQILPFAGKQNTLFNRQSQGQYLGFNESVQDKYVNMVKPVTTNGFVSGTLSLAFTANSFTAPLENLGTPTWLLPQTTEQVSDSIIAVKLPKKLAYPYLVLNSNIVEQKSTYYGSRFTTTIPTLAYLARNYNVADFTYTFQTDWTYEVDKDHIITDFDVQILTPEGNAAPLDDNSSVIFKIIKNNTPEAQMAKVPIKKSQNKK